MNIAGICKALGLDEDYFDLEEGLPEDEICGPATGLIEPENNPFGHLYAVQQQRLMRPAHMIIDLPFDPL